jgi:two-component system sensor histidine kinase KdpD
MKRKPLRWKDALRTAVILPVIFLLNIFLQEVFDTRTLIPMIFVLGVFLISLSTDGYFWGILASLVSVLAVNYTFTAPYYAFDLISPVCLASAAVMLLVAVLTSAITTKSKVSQQLKVEGERERMRANLLRAVSHDLRTPLTSIYGACSAVLENYDSLTPAQTQKLLGEARSDAEWLIRMVENLLSVTRLDSGQVALNKQDTALEELIDAVLTKFYKHCPEWEVQLNMPEDFISIPMDAMLIQQVLLNLLENAVYHAKGMTELHLQVRMKKKQVLFSVWDNGCGIPEEQRRRMFLGELNRSQPVADGSRRNMGIGLSVCAAIIKAHGGWIWADNLPDGGAIFRFYLNLEDGYEQ